MQAIRRILVGVDLSRCHPLEIAALGASIDNTMETAHSLARSCDAELQILTVFNWTEDSMHHLDPEDRSKVKHTFEEKAHLALENLVGKARGKSVRAASKLVLGKPWQEIVREVVRGRHDLLVIGPHEAQGFHPFAGNTAVTLLRTCPCPVWVAKPGSAIPHPNILVASDLGLASDTAMQHGLALGRNVGAKVDVLHVAVCRIDELGWSEQPDPDVKARHQQVLAAAEKQLNEQVQTALNQLPKSSSETGSSVEVHLAEDVGNPAHIIELFIEAHHIDLLVVGTAARHGLAGLIVGNMSERLLPAMRCSLLVVKALDFQCPVSE